MLKSNQTLTELVLSYTQVGNTIVAAIAESLKSNHSLKILDLTGNSQIQAEVGDAILESLKVNKSLIELHLTLTSEKKKEIAPIINEALTRNILIPSQTPILEAIKNNDISEARPLLHKYQDFIKKHVKLYSNLERVKNDEIDTYISKNYFELIGVCKNVHSSCSWTDFPADIMKEVLSYLWPCSLKPQSFEVKLTEIQSQEVNSPEMMGQDSEISESI